MKRRSGFVSNSSTSSFTCDVCGEEYSGWDASPWDDSYDCYICPKEHVMCSEHIKGDVEPPQDKGCDHEFDREEADFCPKCGEPSWVDSDEATISHEQCPVCQFEVYADSDMSKYLLKTREIPRDEVFAKIKAANKRRRKLYNSEYITEVCTRYSLTEDSLLAELKEKFADYDEFSKFIRK